MFGPAKATEIKQALPSAGERHSHAIEQENYRGRHLAHGFCRWFIRKKVATVDCVVKMFPGGIALAFSVDGAVDTSLGADRMRALHRNDRKKIYRMASFGNPHCRCQACKPTAHDCDLDAVARHLLENSSQQSTRTYERDGGIDTNQQQENAKTNARVASQPLSALTDG